MVYTRDLHSRLLQSLHSRHACFLSSIRICFVTIHTLHDLLAPAHKLLWYVPPQADVVLPQVDVEANVARALGIFSGGGRVWTTERHTAFTTARFSLPVHMRIATYIGEAPELAVVAQEVDAYVEAQEGDSQVEAQEGDAQVEAEEGDSQVEAEEG
ncbi:unnamed protein product [Arabis nemorensis]|uniref:Uncharacterized protein n=1 Tax=Arabis nemorensis TaxID=586526 RepID=A0A565BR12_9BRAS|nr:unnamed protein product [Arabis nemorensis]